VTDLVSRDIPHGFSPLSPLVANPLCSVCISWFRESDLDGQYALFVMLGGPGKVIHLEAPSEKLQGMKMPFTIYGNVDISIRIRLVD
jgi:hypothetical protein